MIREVEDDKWIFGGKRINNDYFDYLCMLRGFKMKKRSYNDVQAVMAKLGHKFFTEEMSVNLIFERTSDNFDNVFSDVLHLTYVEKGLQYCVPIPFSTKAGIYGKGSTSNPITTSDGITGTAVVVPGQYRSSHTFMDWKDIKDAGYSQYPWNYPFLRQIKPINIWRDGNKDLVINKEVETKGIYGINIHAGSTIGVNGVTVSSPGYLPWSQGCFVSPEPQFKTIFDTLRKSASKYGQDFTITLIESKSFS